MNGRIEREATPEARLAAVAKSLEVKMEGNRKRPDYADYRDALRPYIQRELILVKIEEARHAAGANLTARVRELAKELAEVNERIPLEDR